MNWIPFLGSQCTVVFSYSSEDSRPKFSVQIIDLRKILNYSFKVASEQKFAFKYYQNCYFCHSHGFGRPSQTLMFVIKEGKETEKETTGTRIRFLEKINLLD